MTTKAVVILSKRRASKDLGTYFTANVNPNNKVSQDFHEKCGFKVIGENNLGLVYVKQVEKDVKLGLNAANKESFKINKFKIKLYNENKEMN